MHVSSGWYSDPARPDTECYWDGDEWTDERPVPAADLSEETTGDAVRSTVGFELPSYEALTRMGADAAACAAAGAPGDSPH